MVVEDEGDDGGFVELLGRQLIAVHPEAAVPGDMDHGLIRVAQLGPDGRPQAEAHGAKAPGGEQLARVVKMEMLDGPHLMLAHVGGHDGVVGAEPGDGVQNLLGRQVVGVLIIGRLRGEGEDILLPLAVVILGHLLVQQCQHLLGVADDVVVGLHILVDLRPVNVDVDNLGLPGKGRRLQGHTVRETAAHGNEQVAAITGHVGGLGAVHADHARGQGVPAGDPPRSHKGNGHRGVNPPGEFPELLMGPAAHYAAAADEHGLLGLGDHLHQLVHILLVGLRHFQAAGPGPADQVGQTSGVNVFFPGKGFILRLLRSDILYDINEHRAGPAAAGDGKGLPHGVGQVVDIPDQIGAFGDGHGNAGNVHLLEGIPSDEVLGHVAGDKHHRG